MTNALYIAFISAIYSMIFIVSSHSTSVFIPLSLITLVLIPSYFVETIFAFIILQWILIILPELIYMVKNYK